MYLPAALKLGLSLGVYHVGDGAEFFGYAIILLYLIEDALARGFQVIARVFELVLIESGLLGLPRPHRRQGNK